MTALVSIRNVVKGYVRGKQRVEVLHGLNLDVEAGEFLALMGPSGSGKTTLLNLIGGLDRPDRGEITVGGRAHRPAVLGPAREVARAARRLRLPVLQPVAGADGGAQRRSAAAADEAVAAASASATCRRRSSSWGSRTARSTSRRSSRAVSSSASRSRARSWRTRRCSCATSRRVTSTARPRSRSWSCSQLLNSEAGQDHRDGHARSARRRSRVAPAVRRQGRARIGELARSRGMKYFPLIWAGLWRKRGPHDLDAAVDRRCVRAVRRAARRHGRRSTASSTGMSDTRLRIQSR